MYHVSSAPQAMVSQEMITRALLDLMGSNVFREITVTQICQEAQVTRQTFYRNYMTKEEVLERYLVRMWMDLNKKYVKAPEDMESNIRNLFIHFPIPKNVLSLLDRSGMFYIVEKTCLDTSEILSKTMPFTHLMGQPEYDKYNIGFVASTVSCVLRIWTENGFRETPEELGSITLSFFAGHKG